MCVLFAFWFLNVSSLPPIPSAVFFFLLVDNFFWVKLSFTRSQDQKRETICRLVCETLVGPIWSSLESVGVRSKPAPKNMSGS